MFTVKPHFTQIKQEDGRKGAILLRTELSFSLSLFLLFDLGGMRRDREHHSDMAKRSLDQNPFTQS
jgi:hypothetical protein